MDIYAYFCFWYETIFRRWNREVTCVESVFEIDYKKINNKKIELIIFDVDDTLTGHHNKIGSKSLRLLSNLEKKFKIAILSNCTTNRRNEIHKMLSSIQFYIPNKAGKPGVNGYKKIFDQYQIKPHQAVMIGDKFSMDMWSAHKAGIKHKILVEPFSETIGGDKSTSIERLIRKFENKLKICDTIMIFT